MHKVTFNNGKEGYAYMAVVDTPYGYIKNDPVQQEYLDICLKASRLMGEEIYENFLDSTYIGNSNLRNSGLV